MIKYTFLAFFVLFLFNMASAQLPEIFRQTMHQGTISAVAFTPDGKFIISGSEDRTIKIWDRNTGYQVDMITDDQFIRQLEFTPDGKKLIIGTSNMGSFSQMYWEGKGRVTIMDFANRKNLQQFSYSSYPTSICCSSDGRYAFIAYTNGYDIIDLETFTSLPNLSTDYQPAEIAVSPDMTMMAFTGKGASYYNELTVFSLKKMDKIKPVFSQVMSTEKVIAFSPDSKYLACGNDGGNIKMLDTKKFKEAAGFQPSYNDKHKAPIWKIKFSLDGNFLITSSSDETIKIWDAKNGKLINTFEEHNKILTDFDLAPDTVSIVSSAFENAFKYWNISSCKSYSTFNFQCPIVYALDISSDGSIFVTVSDDNRLRVYDYKTSTLLRTLEGHTIKTKHICLSPNGKYIVSASSDEVDLKYVGEVMLWEASTGKLIKKLSSGNVYSISFSPDSKQFIVADGSSSSPSYIYNISTNTKTELWEKTGYSTSLQEVFWLPDGETILVAGGNPYSDKRLSKQSLVKRNSWQFLDNGADGSFYTKALSTDRRFFAACTYNNTLYVWNLNAQNLHTTLMGESASAITFSHDSKQLALIQSGDITIWDMATSNKIKTIKINFGTVNTFKFSPDNRFLLLGCDDGTVRRVNLLNDEWIASVGDETGTQWVIFNSDNYWDASSQVNNLIVSKKGSLIFGIDQVAVWSNRPDKIYQKFGNTDQQTINHYYNQYLKRLRKLGLSENKSSLQIEIPEVKIVESNQTGKYLNLKLSFSKLTSKITVYNIFINDIPIFGAKGKIYDESLSTINEQVELSAGKNKIEVSCTNANGIESFRALTMANYNKPVPKNLYLIAFGVSKYQNSAYNLRFADKDALDLSKVIESFKGKGFENVYTKVLTNEQVTPEAITAAKDFVKDAKPDDTFILFIAGHGMHDKDAEATYYYLTSNADINNLKGTAADFETIEDLLQGIPPRNKLFLMDACESGEIDEEDQGQMLAVATGAGIASRGFKIKAVQGAANNQIVAKRSYLYQKDRYIYNDLVRRSGAIVFSSSKGGELSYERSDIENGLFTEFIMKALTTTEADKDNNGTVTTDELRQYVSEQVAKASGDLQHPTVDRDNIYQKFGFRVN